MGMNPLLHEILGASASARPDKGAVFDAGGSLSYGALFEKAFVLGGRLVALGVSPGDRIAIVMPNSRPFFLAQFSVIAAGAVTVPCDAAVAPASLERVILDSEARFVFLTADGALRFADILKKLGCRALVFGDEKSKTPPLAPSEDLVLVDELTQSKDLPTRSERDLVTLMYTTGSTGSPKGVMLTHANVIHAIRNICNFVGYDDTNRELITLPLSHNFGLGQAYCNLRSGGAIWVENGLSRIGRVLETLDSFRATAFPGTPMGYGLLIDRYGALFKEKAKHLRSAVINSAPLPPERTTQILELFPKLDLYVYYGLTEASRSTFISLSSEGSSHYRSVGRPMSGIKVIARDVQGTEVSQGTDGEIFIQGPTLSQGYWKQPEETAKAFENGWLRTGDLGRFDENGFLFLTGRLKEQINVGGYKVNPNEIEAVLAKFEGIQEVAVAGIDNIAGFTGESVVAAVVPQAGANLNFEELEKYCLAKLERFKVPTRYVVIARIPRTDSGKIKRFELVDEIKKKLS